MLAESKPAKPPLPCAVPDSHAGNTTTKPEKPKRPEKSKRVEEVEDRLITELSKSVKNRKNKMEELAAQGNLLIILENFLNILTFLKADVYFGKQKMKHIQKALMRA